MEERKYWYPAQTMSVDIRAEPGALVCLIGGHAGPEGKGGAGTQNSKSRYNGLFINYIFNMTLSKS